MNETEMSHQEAEEEVAGRGVGQRLVQIAIFLLVVNLVLACVMEYQILTRNDNIDNIEEDAGVIRRLADDLTKQQADATPGPDLNSQLPIVFEQVEAIYEVIVNQANGG